MSATPGRVTEAICETCSKPMRKAKDADPRCSSCAEAGMWLCLCAGGTLHGPGIERCPRCGEKRSEGR